MVESEAFMTVGEARALLGIGRRKIADLIAKGVLPAKPDPLDSRIKLLRRADVENLRAQSKKSSSQG